MMRIVGQKEVWEKARIPGVIVLDSSRVVSAWELNRHVKAMGLTEDEFLTWWETYKAP